MPMGRDPAEAFARLFAVSEGQGGYFTASQALSAGYSYRLQHYHVRRGNWLKVERNLYRLRAFPLGDREDLIRWSFWSLGRGVVSHDSALEFHGIGDVVPDRIHLTVPRSFRKRASGVVLHRGEFGIRDLEHHLGFRVSVPLRTILDVADSELDPDRFNDAVQQALRGGHVRQSRLIERMARLSERGRRRLEAAMRETVAA